MGRMNAECWIPKKNRGTGQLASSGLEFDAALSEAPVNKIYQENCLMDVGT